MMISPKRAGVALKAFTRIRKTYMGNPIVALAVDRSGDVHFVAQWHGVNLSMPVGVADNVAEPSIMLADGAAALKAFKVAIPSVGKSVEVIAGDRTVRVGSLTLPMGRLYEPEPAVRTAGAFGPVQEVPIAIPPHAPPSFTPMFNAGFNGATLGRLLPFASKDQTRYVLNGMHVDGKARGLVTTDGHRLAMETDVFAYGAGIVAAFALEALGAKDDDVIRVSGRYAEPKAADAGPQPTDLHIGVVVLTPDSPDAVIWGPDVAITGRFPDYMQVVPVGNPTSVRVDAVDFERRIAAMASPMTKIGKRNHARSVKLAINGAVDISMSDPDVGEAKDRMEHGGHDGPDLAIGINNAYLRDALKAVASVAGAAVLISGSDNLSPLRIEPDATSASYVHVVMPMRI